MKSSLRIQSLTVLSLVLFSQIAFAGISVEPTVTEKVIEPGKNEEGIYILTNMGEKKVDVSVELEDWMARLHGLKDDIDVNEWLSVNPNKVTLEPGQKVELKYLAKAPVKFTNEKVAQVFFTFSENETLTQRLGVIFYMSAKGAHKLKAEIAQLSASYDSSDPNKPRLILFIEIRNDSNFHIRPLGSLTLWDADKKFAFKTLILDRVPGIYPGKSSSFNYIFPYEKIPTGSYKVKVALNYGQMYAENAVMEKTTDLVWENTKKDSK